MLTQDNFLLLLRKQDVKYKYIYWRRQGNLVFLQQLYTSVRVVLHHWVFLASTTPLMNGLVGPLQSFIHVSSDIESRSKKTTKKQNTYWNHLTEFFLLFTHFLVNYYKQIFLRFKDSVFRDLLFKLGSKLYHISGRHITFSNF